MVFICIHLLTVDIESGKFMDETNALFNLYKAKYFSEIERRHRQITVKVVLMLVVGGRNLMGRM